MTLQDSAGLLAARNNLRGIAAMCIAMAAFAANDMLMKAALQSVPLYQAIALRGLLTVSALAALAAALGRPMQRLPARDAWLLALRSLAEVGATVAFLAALARMPLANLSAIMQSLPLAVTLAAAVVFGERVGQARAISIVAGFCGVLLIVRPGSDGFTQGAVLGLVSMALVVVRDLATRRMSAALPTVTVATVAAGSVAAAGLVGATLRDEWSGLAARDLWCLAGASGFLVLGYLTVVQATRVGDVAAVAPFRYTALLWALVLGWLAFGTLPDIISWMGIGMIVASGLYSLRWQRPESRF